jgi:hypothetical protein
MPNPSRLLIILIILTLAAIVHADDLIVGKVVGVAGGAVGVSQKSANIPAAGLGSKTGRDRLSWQSQLKGFPSSIL